MIRRCYGKRLIERSAFVVDFKGWIRIRVVFIRNFFCLMLSEWVIVLYWTKKLEFSVILCLFNERKVSGRIGSLLSPQNKLQKAALRR